MAEMLVIQTKDLSFSYQKGGRKFHFPNITCQAGEVCLISGQSGQGKTTLLHLLAGLLKPEEGDIIIKGQNLNNLRAENKDKFRGKNIGLVYQKPQFIYALSVKDNLLLAQYLAGMKQDVSVIKKMLERLQLGDKLHQKTHRLSEGEKQRVSIARAVIINPALVLADEPTSSLDDINCQKVIDLFESEILNAGIALLIVSHDARLKNIYSKNLMEL